ncbi:Alg9-like mannosyltransferase family-domain-containing protein [Sporodiniella umbellata]|nr:Alg9-like mannosyltransferase family-domain-containing protein [Sporodiniella umbellata]
MSALTNQTSTVSSRVFVFGICLTFRLINAYFTRTYDNPDEYWQGQEVAHYLTFQYGYLTWEWREKIRSFAHPLAISLTYKLLQISKLDQTSFFVFAPRFTQAAFTAVADFSIYSLSKRIIGTEIALPILFTTLCSWFNFFMAARTLSNTAEMILTVIALNYWPLPGLVNTDLTKRWLKNYRISLFFGSIACVIRPTNALIWMFLGIQLLLSSKRRFFIILLNAMFVCSVVLFLNVLIDTGVYESTWSRLFKSPIITSYLFFKVNVVNGISLFYGVHKWHWYLVQGLPVVLTSMMPFGLFGLYKIRDNPNLYNRIKPLLLMSAWVVFVYSLLPHKEFRFIYPIVPVLLMVTSYGLHQIPSSIWRKRAYIFLILTQLPMAFYLSFYHQRGVIESMLWLRAEIQKARVESIGVLMPCHSTPWDSILHSPHIPKWFLSCEPPLSLNSVDEADLFYQDPALFLKLNTNDRIWPTSHLVLFDNLLSKLDQELQKLGYKECQRFFNSHFHDDSRRKGDVVILCQQKTYT